MLSLYLTAEDVNLNITIYSFPTSDDKLALL